MYINENMPQEGIFCLNCRHFNLPGAQVCEKCQNKLFSLSPAPPKQNQLYREIENQTLLFKNRQISLREYWDFLVKRQVAFEKISREIKELDIPEEFKIEMKEEIDSGLSGISYFQEGLKVLQEFCENKNESFAEQGLNLVKTGNDLLNRAMALNWDSFVALKQTAEEFLAQQQKNI